MNESNNAIQAGERQRADGGDDSERERSTTYGPLASGQPEYYKDTHNVPEFTA